MAVTLKAIRPKKFKNLDPTRTKANVRKGMQNYLESVKKQLQEYPEQKNTAYTRRYRLKRGWTIAKNDGTEGLLVNGIWYAVYAQGPRGGGRGKGERQTQIMRSLGWKSISDIARETRPRFKQIMNRAVKGRP